MKKRIFWPHLIYVVLLGLLAACGPAAPDSAATAENPVPAEGGDTAVNTIDPSSSTVSTQEATNTSQDTDANGIEVGFTEDGHPYRGQRDAPVVLEEFSDYQCPFCARFYSQTLPSLEANQIANGEAVLIFYDFPLTSIHPQAVAAANAARCAGDQGAAAYWGMHDLIFANGEAWANSDANTVFAGFASQLGLDAAQFEACQNSNKYANEIQNDLDLGRSRGVSSTPSFFVNGQALVGAQPLSVFNEAIATVSDGGELPTNEPEPAPPSQPAVAPTPAAIPTDNIAAAMGDPEAPVTIVEYTDYQCPFCQRHSQQTIPQLITEMIETGRVYYIMKDFPLDNLHPNARTAAAAARCAGEQALYWEMHDAIFDSQTSWAEGDAAPVLAGLAAELGLDIDSYTECVESNKYADAVQANLEEGSQLGVTGTPAFFINGFPVSGAQPFNVFEYGIGLAEEGTLAEAYVPREQPAQPTAVPPPTGPVDVPVGDAYSLGDPDAPVVIVEYTDYQCPYCSRHFQQTFPAIKENFIDTGLVRYVFKDFPLVSIHPQAVAAAHAARCAGDQGAYVEMHDVLFATQAQWNNQSNAVELFVEYAGQLGLDTAEFNDCQISNKYVPAIQADSQEGASFGVRGTPAFFINGSFISGAQPYSVFEQAINSLLNQEG